MQKKTNFQNKTTQNFKPKQTNKLENTDKSSIPNGIIQDPNIYTNRVENFQRQQVLRRLLKEFGLAQYLRVKNKIFYKEILRIRI